MFAAGRVLLQDMVEGSFLFEEARGAVSSGFSRDIHRSPSGRILHSYTAVRYDLGKLRVLELTNNGAYQYRRS